MLVNSGSSSSPSSTNGESVLKTAAGPGLLAEDGLEPVLLTIKGRTSWPSSGTLNETRFPSVGDFARLQNKSFSSFLSLEKLSAHLLLPLPGGPLLLPNLVCALACLISSSSSSLVSLAILSPSSIADPTPAPRTSTPLP